MTLSPPPGADGVRLTKAQSLALAVLGQADGRNVCVWIMPKTMASLVVLGLAETYTPPSVAERPRMKARPWRITPAGRAALSTPPKENDR